MFFMCSDWLFKLGTECPIHAPPGIIVLSEFHVHILFPHLSEIK